MRNTQQAGCESSRPTGLRAVRVLTSRRQVSSLLSPPCLQLRMNISKDDAVAHLAKWFQGENDVRALYSTITGQLTIVGRIADLSSEVMEIAGSGCRLKLYFRTTSTFDYSDARELPTAGNKDRENKYPTVISIKFSSGESIEIVEHFVA